MPMFSALGPEMGHWPTPAGSTHYMRSKDSGGLTFRSQASQLSKYQREKIHTRYRPVAFLQQKGEKAVRRRRREQMIFSAGSSVELQLTRGAV